MLRLSRKTDYGLIALRHLARAQPAASASARQIAARYGLPQPLLAKVLQRLARRGLLEPVYGTRGGYRLARRPEQISTLEVILALDGPVGLTSCLNPRGRCRQSRRCTVQAPLRRLHEAILALLAATSISALGGDAMLTAPVGSRRARRASAQGERT